MIINNHRIANHCVFKRTAVHCAAGTNLYPVTNAHTTKLVNLLPATLAIGCKAKAICPDHRATVYSDSTAYDHIMIDGDIGRDQAVSTQN